jgi:two-component system, NtrC family, nitrogen regulation sensor histidine kinase NtrY
MKGCAVVKPWRELRHQHRILLFALLAGFPATIVAGVLLFASTMPDTLRWPIFALILLCWIGFSWACFSLTVRPLQTVSNIVHGLRSGDFSTRGGGGRKDDALGLVIAEVNELANTLRDQRIGALEATALLRTVMAEIDVAVFAFDGEEKLRLVNRAGERLLSLPAPRILGLSAAALRLDDCLHGDTPRTVDQVVPGGTGRWEIRRRNFRQGGLPHQLLVIADLSRALRQEERQAWQRLIRVLSHEINNSLTPIHSIAGSLLDLLCRDDRPPDWQDDLVEGLRVVEGRSGALTRFMAEYARLARLPPPRPRPLVVSDWVHRAAAMEPRLPVRIIDGPAVTIEADSDQLDQLLINLVRNAVDASLETGGAVEMGWGVSNGQLETWIADQGPGLANPANLFVPFFSTKPQGTGIGLVLSRQIAEAHGGSLALRNRDGGRGCEARLILPITQREHA